MEKLPNWSQLWRKLSAVNEASFMRHRKKGSNDPWKNRAQAFDKNKSARAEQRSSSPVEKYMIQKVQSCPDASLLDIGAGTGKWALLLSTVAKSITALEPSAAMREVLEHNIATQKRKNIQIAVDMWPTDTLPQHDYVLASHSMYGVADLPRFVEAMEQTAKKGCFLLVKAPLTKGLMAKASLEVFGQPYDSPNFQVAYNILLGMNIFADVVMEGKGSWKQRTSESYESALLRLKQKLNIKDTTVHDQVLASLLKKHLLEENGTLVWPQETSSALLYWDVER